MDLQGSRHVFMACDVKFGFDPNKPPKVLFGDFGPFGGLSSKNFYFATRKMLSVNGKRRHI